MTNEPIDLAEARAALAAAHEMVSALCQPRNRPGARDWIMSIPARPDYDPDIVISEGLRRGDRAIRELERLREEVKQYEAHARITEANAGRWIPLTDEPLPRPGQFVLVTDGSQVGHATLYIGPPPRFCTDEGLDVGPVTHWMPLPSPPDSDAREGEG